ncbi:hypothetical protein Droror1_Dr00022268 [Drosera rotundifolia]
MPKGNRRNSAGGRGGGGGGRGSGRGGGGGGFGGIGGAGPSAGPTQTPQPGPSPSSFFSLLQSQPALVLSSPSSSTPRATSRHHLPPSPLAADLAQPRRATATPGAISLNHRQ